MLKVIRIEKNDIPESIDNLGGIFNECPPNLEEITEDDFFYQIITYYPDYMDYRYCLDHEEYPWLHLHMFIYDEGNGISNGVAIARTPDGRKFYSFAVCVHEWESVPEESHMCYHVSRCKKCGIKRAMDSSD